MSLLRSTPRFTAAEAAALAHDLYGVAANADPLAGERDQNFLLGTPAGRFVLKIANAAESRAMLEAQNAAMSHVANLALCPRVIPAPDGREIVEAPGGYLVRLLTWLPGVPLASLPHRPATLLDDLGRRIAELDRSLQSFDHPAIHRSFHWDLARGTDVVRAGLDLIADGAWRARVAEIAARVEALDLLAGSRLRRSAIHNDGNDHNVLVVADGDLTGQHARVAGLIDFGDMVHSVTVGDLAVTVAYAVLDQPDPLAAAERLVGGYHRVYPLTDEEISAIWPLAELRLCMSVCLAARQQAERPDDEYLSVSQEPIRRTLPRMADIHPRVAAACFRHACARPPTRRRHLGPGLRLSYREPLQLVRGTMQYVYDRSGRRFLDAYNNVPHVGHSHPRVVQAAHDQMRQLNTNTRYLYEALEGFASRLVDTLPSSLRVCYFVNSGSEANELALRLARAHTGSRDVLVLEHAYHGNTTTLIDISPYKFDGPGGGGRQPWVHVVPIPDLYRGRFRDDDAEAAARYAAAVGGVLNGLKAAGRARPSWIAETCPSVAGQIVLPRGYLAAVYNAVRAAGGICIADEVQTAYGRMGTSFYAFQDHGVVPDIVVLGKPIGNGYPLGAVVTTEDVAASFDNGMEFFSTFGGSTVACAVGLAVLDVLKEERLQPHAAEVGGYLVTLLRGLADRHEMIGDIRGSGFFLGVELVKDRGTRRPAGAEASYVVNRLREEGILIGTEGPHDNVLKIRPPMPFSRSDADLLAGVLDDVLSELG